MEYIAYFIEKNTKEVEYRGDGCAYAGIFPMPQNEPIFEDSEKAAIKAAKKRAKERKQILGELVKVTHKTIYQAPTRRVTMYKL